MSLLRKFFGGKSRRVSKRSISNPRNFQHCFHGEFDLIQGRFCGLPPQWSNLLEHEEQNSLQQRSRQNQHAVAHAAPRVVTGDCYLDQKASKWIRNSYFSDDEGSTMSPTQVKITSMPNVNVHDVTSCRMVTPTGNEITMSQPLLDGDTSVHSNYAVPDPYSRRREVWSPQSVHSSGYWSSRQQYTVQTNDMSGYVSAGSISSYDRLDEPSYRHPPVSASSSYISSQPVHYSPHQNLPRSLHRTAQHSHTHYHNSHHHHYGEHRRSKRSHRSSQRGQHSSYEEFRASLVPYVNPADPRHMLTELNKIGEGSTGIVYSARMISTGEMVAVKKMNLRRQQRRELLFNEVYFHVIMLILLIRSVSLGAHSPGHRYNLWLVAFSASCTLEACFFYAHTHFKQILLHPKTVISSIEKPATYKEGSSGL